MLNVRHFFLHSTARPIAVCLHGAGGGHEHLCHREGSGPDVTTGKCGVVVNVNIADKAASYKVALYTKPQESN